MSKTIQKQKTQYSSFKAKWISISIMSILSITAVILLTYASVYVWKNWYMTQFEANASTAKGKEWAEHGLLTTNNKELWAWGTVDSGYKALFFTSISLALVGLFVLGAWLRGASWINKTNRYIKGQVYVRNGEQKLVFRVLAIIVSLAMLWSFGMEMFYGVVDKANGEKYPPEEILKKLWEWLLNPDEWYFQCYLSSLFISIALIKRKYNWMLVLLPVAILGSARTFIDVKDDWGDKAVSTSVYFHRFMMIHVMIIAAPLFFAFANRARYDLVTIKRTLQYTFAVVIVAYLIFNTMTIVKWIDQTKTRHDIDLDWYGELAGVGGLIGKKADWINEHANTYFWLILCPFGISIILGMALISNVTHYAIEYKGSFFKKWWETVKKVEFDKLKDSMYTSRRFANLVTKETKTKINKKYAYIPFGLEVPANVLNQETL